MVQKSRHPPRGPERLTPQVHAKLSTSRPYMIALRTR